MNRVFTRLCMMVTMSLTSCQLMAQAPPPPLDNPLQDINQQLRDVFTPLSKFASEEIMVLVNYGQLPFTEKIITWVSAFLPQEYFVK